jgi:putative hydrolase of the HAD superfamily
MIKQASLNHIEGVIWDLDDTLYTVTPALKESMRHSAAHTVIGLGHDIGFDDALSLAEQSQHEYRVTFKLLNDRFNIEHKDLHFPFHAGMDETVIDPVPELVTAFTALPQIKHSIITHASREWALKMLDHLGIADFFAPSAVFGLEDINYEHKDKSDRATKTCLSAIGVDANKAAFAEDRDYNLTIPHEMGLTTVLMDHPSQTRELAHHVHYRFDHAIHFLNEIASGQLQKTA